LGAILAYFLYLEVRVQLRPSGMCQSARAGFLWQVKWIFVYCPS